MKFEARRRERWKVVQLARWDRSRRSLLVKLEFKVRGGILLIQRLELMTSSRAGGYGVSPACLPLLTITQVSELVRNQINLKGEIKAPNKQVGVVRPSGENSISLTFSLLTDSG